MSHATAGKNAIFIRAPEPGERNEDRWRSEAADRPAGAPDAAPPPPALDARGLRATLAHAFDEDPSKRLEVKPAEPAPVKPAAATAEPRRGLLSRATGNKLVKVGLGLGLVVVFGWMPFQTLLVASSVEAVVNSRIVTIRSPIDGVIASAPHDFKAWSAAKGAPVLRVVDDRADRAHLDDLRRQLGNLEDERPSLVRRLGLAQANLNDLTKQTQLFADGRVKQLSARTEALNHDLAAASARAVEADAALTRANALTKSGFLTVAEGDRLRRDKIVAAENEFAARRRLDEASVELSAANQGFFLGDSYNDRPDSAQRAEEMRLRVGDLAAAVEVRDAQIKRLRVDIADEAARYENRSNVEVALPVSGRVWEVLTAPGEHVARGQDLLRLLDCTSAVVTANVSESVYNRLQVGSPATFRPSSGGEDYPGTIVNLTGIAGAPANFAIIPSTLVKEAYHVTVAVPKIAEGDDCGVGRTGRVIFQKGEAEASATSAEASALGLRP
jgi:multidrug resistance efflux pump